MSEKNFQLDDNDLEEVSGGLAKASYTLQNGAAKPQVVGMATPGMGEAKFAFQGPSVDTKLSQPVVSESHLKNNKKENWV